MAVFVVQETKPNEFIVRFWRKNLNNRDLQDYVDGRLSDTRQKEIEGYLADHPEQAARVRAYQRQNRLLKNLNTDILEEPIPARLLDILEKNTE